MITSFVVFDVLIISRFKRIKEQEARLRQQREEEGRKAEEAAKLESQTINDSDKSEELQSESSSKSTTVVVVANGGVSRQDVKEDQNSTSMATMQRTDVDDEVASISQQVQTQEEVNSHWL